jgi:hypothetical protein
MSDQGAPLAVAIRGPLVLITLGVLFLVDHFGPFRFGQTWPVLVIVYGLLKLLERTGERKPPRTGFPEGFAP